MEESLELEGRKKQQTRTSKFNVYESVFKLVINDNMDLWECVPDLLMYWEGPWGRLVTLQIVSSHAQFNTILTLLQKATDTLQLSDHLVEAVAPSQSSAMHHNQY